MNFDERHHNLVVKVLLATIGVPRRTIEKVTSPQSKVGTPVELSPPLRSRKLLADVGPWADDDVPKLAVRIVVSAPPLLDA